MSGLTLRPGRYPADMSRVGLGTPPPATPAAQVGAPEAGPSTIQDPARIPRRLGLTGALMMGIGALGAGALPVTNPLFGLRVISLPRERHRRHRDHLRRHGHAGAGLAVDRPHAAGPRRGGPGPGPHPARAHRAAVGAAARAGAADVLQGRLQLPRTERDHRARARPVLARAGGGAGRRRPAHPHDPHDLARHPRPVRPAVPHARPRHHRADRLGRDPGGVRPPRPRPLRRGADHLGAAAAGPPLRPRRRPRPLARRGEPAGAVPPGQRHPQRGPDDRARCSRASSSCCAPSTGRRTSCATRGSCSARWSSRWAPRSSSRRSWRSGFVGMAAARQRGGRVRDVAVVAAVSGAVAAAVFVALGVGSGLGFGWTRTLGTANVIRSWMSLATDLGQLSGQVGILAGLGDHTDTVLTITRGLGGLARRAAVPAAAAARAARAAGPGDRAGGRAGRGGAARAGGAPLVPAVGGDPAGRHPRDAAAPARRAGGVGAARGHAAPTGADFAFRSFQLPLAILAGIVILRGRAAGRAAGAACGAAAGPRARPRRRRAAVGGARRSTPRRPDPTPASAPAGPAAPAGRRGSPVPDRAPGADVTNH